MGSRPRGFTLIELLVVVAIIAALLAILLPAVSRSIEKARIAVCLSNHHTFGVAHVAFASEQFGRFVDGWASSGMSGNCQNAIWVKSAANSHATYGGYRELGYLAHKGYLGKPEKILYCPGMPPNLWAESPYSLNGPQDKYAWPENGDLDATGLPWVHDHYNYRNSINAPNFRAPHLNKDPGNLTVHADFFTTPITYRTHADGLPILKLDGSTRFINDPKDSIRNFWGAAPWNTMFGGTVGCTNQETVYLNVLDRY